MDVANESAQTTPRRLPFWVILLAFILLIGFLALVGLGLKRVQAGPITIGSKVPNFALQSFNGQSLNTSDYLGKVVVINFWASWCKPCEAEAADLQKAWEYYQPGGEVLFVGVDYVDVEPKALAYMEIFGITYFNAPDLGGKVSQRFRITGVPETYFVGRDGTLAFKQWGPFNNLAEIQSIIDGLLD